MAEQLIGDTGYEAVHFPACRMFPSRRVPMCRLRHYIIISVDITPVAKPEQVLVHLIRPRHPVASVELLRRERANHSFIRFELISPTEVLNPRALIPCKMLRAEAMRTQNTEHKFNGELKTETQSTRERQGEQKDRNLIQKIITLCT